MCAEWMPMTVNDRCLRMGRKRVGRKGGAGQERANSRRPLFLLLFQLFYYSLLGAPASQPSNTDRTRDSSPSRPPSQAAIGTHCSR
jgi:hypothetical protein